MAERVMVSPRKWDLWYRRLSPAYKTMWDFLYTNPLGCSRAGIWDRDDETAQYWVNDKSLNLDEFFEKSNEGQERIKTLKDGKKWFVVDYITTQNPNGLKRFDSLGRPNKVHSGIYAELERYGLDPYFYELKDFRGSVEGLDTLLDKDKAKEKDKDKEKEKAGEEGLVLLSQEERQKLQGKMGAKKTQEYIQKLEYYIGSKGRKYKSHYFTILSWWNKDGAPKDPVKQAVKAPEKPEVVLTDAERKNLIKQALPTFGGGR